MSSRVPYTSSNLIKIIKDALEEGSQQFFCVPLTLKLLSETPNGVDLLAKFQSVNYAGSVCPKSLGDHLVENGVKLQTYYGATETGLCLSTFRDCEKDKGWDIMRPTPQFIKFARWEEQEDDPGVYELVIEKGFPSLSAVNRPDGAYATSDLFTRHPTMPNGFYYLSRKDDSLVHVHGKKTNPLLIETDLRSSPLIKDAMVFGANRMQTGCLIIPQSDDLTFEDLREAINFANKRAPTWSRLENEMVIILSSSESFVMRDKMSLIRAKTNKKFDNLIEEKYNSVERNLKGQEVEKVKLITLTQALSFVRTIVSEVMQAQITHLGSIKEDDNLFDKGLDSLAVMRIGSLIRSRVEFPLGIEASETAAFHHPTIRTLAEYLYRLSSGANQQNEHDENAHSLNLMRRLLNKYTERIETRSASTVVQAKNGKETILLTGSTGSLGAHLFSIAAKRQDVEAIICLCRAKTDEEAQERVNKSLAERRLPATQHFASNCKIICLSSDLADAHLGLVPEMYQIILQNVTSIVHAAWPVNFSMGVSAFESSLQGCLNLINLASKSSLACPPQLIFCSSIAAASFHKSGKGQNGVMEEPSIDPKDAIPNGYGRSKWIAEALFDAAAIKIANLRSKIIRIGQLSGDLQNGIWNEKEAYPLLIKTAQTIGSLPDLSNQSLYWLPVDIAAEMIIEVTMQKKDERGIQVVHVASKEVTEWNQIVLAVRHAYPKVRQVPLTDWLEELRTAKDQDPKSNPAVKLLDHYSSWSNTSQGGIPNFDTAYVNTLLASKPQILKYTGALSQDNLTKMISAWQQNEFLIHA